MGQLTSFPITTKAIDDLTIGVINPSDFIVAQIGGVTKKVTSQSVANLYDGFSGDYNDLTNKPILAAVATTGSYLNLVNTPSLSSVATSGLYSDLVGSPTLALVAATGNYSDLVGTPVVPTTLDSLTNVQITSPALNDVLAFNGTNWVNSAAGSGSTGTQNLASVLLFGNTTGASDIVISAGRKITSPSNTDLKIAPNGTGNLLIGIGAQTVRFPSSIGTAGQVLSSDGSGQLYWSYANGNSGTGVSGLFWQQSIGDGSAISFVVTHNFNTRDVICYLYDVNTNLMQVFQSTHTSVNSVTYSFISPPALNSKRALVVNASGNAVVYSLPTASAGVLGGIKVGSGLSIDVNGVLSVDGGGSGYTLPPATTSTLGGVKVGSGLFVDSNGVISSNASGTVTSIGLTIPTSFLAVNQSAPIDVSGSFDITLINQPTNTVFASSASGPAGVPSFRNVVAADFGSAISDITKFLRGDGTWADIPNPYTGGITLPISGGGTGQTTAPAALAALGGMTSTLNSGRIFVGNASNVATGVMVTGDVTMSNTGLVTLVNTPVLAGLYGSASNSIQLTVDSKGRVVTSQNIAISIPFSSVTSTPTTLIGYGIVDAVSSTLVSGKLYVGNSLNVATGVSMSGDATISDTGILTLASVANLNTVGSPTHVVFGSSSMATVLDVSEKGLILNANQIPINISSDSGVQWINSTVPAAALLRTQINMNTNSESRVIDNSYDGSIIFVNASGCSLSAINIQSFNQGWTCKVVILGTNSISLGANFFNSATSSYSPVQSGDGVILTLVADKRVVGPGGLGRILYSK